MSHMNLSLSRKLYKLSIFYNTQIIYNLSENIIFFYSDTKFTETPEYTGNENNTNIADNANNAITEK